MREISYKGTKSIHIFITQQSKSGSRAGKTAKKRDERGAKKNKDGPLVVFISGCRYDTLSVAESGGFEPPVQ